MRRPPAWLGVATLVLCVLPGRARATNDTLKPYVFLIIDTSGSMATATGFGPPSCPGSVDTRLDHAKCALENLSNSYGDMVLGLGRFRETTIDNNCADGCTMTGIDCNACNNGTGAGCTTAMSSDARLEVLTGLVDGNNADIARWNDFTCGTCTSTLASNPDVYIGGYTPLAGSLKGAKRYYQGLQATDGTTLWPAASAGFDPIANDPLRAVLLNNGTGPQCRPYIVILATDGDETCTTFASTTAAATSLLTTQKTVIDPVTGLPRTINYRIETKPIGLGQTPPDTQIEGLAHAGGATDVANQNEGFYAQNEEELELAISQIVADSLRFELCNGQDDDCDTRVDEDFPDLGTACNDGLLGLCRGTGTKVCTATGQGTTCQITSPGQAPTMEICNNLDDDCDGAIDEDSVCVGCGTVELCNGLDDDCDNIVDEDLVRTCGTDVGECTAGTETCSAGAWVGCNATGPFTEVCDGIDNDCDGVVDGLTQACTNLPPPGNPNTGPCHPGIQVCPPDGTGMWGGCLGEIGPVTEACDTIDNDCDGNVDEDTGGADCSSSCGVGQTVCMNGVIQCQGGTTGGTEICNGLDDDCDHVIDEDIPDPISTCNMAPDGTPLCMPGVLRCVNGAPVCQGGTPIQPEQCDCMDNDCDNQVDEQPPALCPSGQQCVSCQCAAPCQSGEFPCPAGRVCQAGFCVTDVCANVHCAADERCDQGTCIPACQGVTCDAGFVCVAVDGAGQCKPDDCTTFPDRCSAQQQCVAGVCVTDPCAGVTCGAGEYCTNGTCASSCTGVVCPSHQVCQGGHCVADACGDHCPTNQVCNTQEGTCVPDPCLGHPPCPSGEVCDPQTGNCERDPCLGVTCPDPGDVCTLGTCARPGAPPDEFVTAAGGGGCSAAGGGLGAGTLALLALVGLSRRPRRRHQVAP